MGKRIATVTVVGGVLLATVALASGAFQGFPLATNGTSNSFPLTGNETIPADTNLTSGQYPQTELLTPGVLATIPGQGVFKNALIGGGDFAQNLWQRGTSFTSITNSVTYTADRWAAKGGASSSISVSKQTGATDIPVGYGASLRFQRADSNANTTAVCLAQALESSGSYRFQSGTAVLSFHAYAPTTFSGSGIDVTLASGTGVDGSMANLFTGGWTGYAAAAPASAGSTVAGGGSSTQVGGGGITLGTASANVPLSATWQRYWIAFPVPKAAAQLGVKICFTPSGTASSDYLEITGAQLELNGSGVPSSVERLAAPTEATRELRYYWEQDEAASDSTVYGTCQGGALATTGAQCTMTLPVPMRAAPTIAYTAGTISATVGTAGAASAVSALTVTKASTYAVSLAATATSVATITGFLEGGNSTGGGKIKLSAEL